MSKDNPTMKDVARLAGVSQPTVSYVINGSASISKEVKERYDYMDKQIRDLNASKTELEKIISQLRRGEIDIIIGTPVEKT